MRNLIFVTTREYYKYNNLKNYTTIELQELVHTITTGKEFKDYDDKVKSILLRDFFAGKTSLEESDIQKARILEVFDLSDYEDFWVAWTKTPSRYFEVVSVNTDAGDTIIVAPCFAKKITDFEYKQECIGVFVKSFIERYSFQKDVRVYVIAHDKDLFEEETFRQMKTEDLVDGTALSKLLKNNVLSIYNIYGFQHIKSMCKMYQDFIVPFFSNNISASDFVKGATSFIEELNQEVTIPMEEMQGKLAGLYKDLFYNG